MLLSISSSPMDDRGPRYAEQFFRALEEAQVPLTLVFGRHEGRVGLFISCDDAYQQTVRSLLAGTFSTCALRSLDDEALDPDDETVWTLDLRLRPDYLPLRPYTDYEDRLTHSLADPITGILSVLAEPPAIRTQIEIDLEPLSWWRLWRTGRRLRRLDDAEASAAVEKLDHPFRAHVRLFAFAVDADVHAVHEKLYDLHAALGQFTEDSQFRSGFIRRRRTLTPSRFARRSLLSAAELATLFHAPTSTVRAPKMHTIGSRQQEPPTELARLKEREPDGTVLGRVEFREQRDAFVIPSDARFRHVAVVGKTGVGKSTLLLNMIAADMAVPGRGVAVVDPHGDLAEAMLALVPSRRTNDVVLFDPADRGFPVAYNPLHVSDEAQRPLVASGVVSALKKLYADSWGPRSEHILRNAVLASLESPGSSFLSLLRLLGDEEYRSAMIDRVSDPLVRAFWEQEFGRWNDRYRHEAIAPIQNKLGQFLSNPTLRSILGQSRSTVDLRAVIDEGRILVVNLSKGRIGEDASSLLGAFLVTGLQLAAMSRADVLESQRQPCYCFVDEFQNFTTEAFATILSESRKYRLAFTLANQYLEQMDEGTLEATFGNVGNLVVFQVGPRDAGVLVEQLGGDLLPADLINLPRYSAYCRLLIDGVPSRPFSMTTLPPAERVDITRTETIRRVSRQRYGRPAQRVQREIAEALVHV